MILNSKSRRRWFGAVCLLAAVVMLIAGETVLKGRLSTLAFLLYWLGCFGFTVLAMCIALLDVRELRQQSRTEQRELLEHTLDEIRRNKSGRE